MRRARTTTRRVRIADALARWSITVGGVTTVACVLGVLIFLIWITLPLLWPARWGDPARFEWPGAGTTMAAIDEYRSMAVRCSSNAIFEAVHLPGGHPLGRWTIPGADRATAVRWDPHEAMAVTGMDDGSMAFHRTRFAVRWTDVTGAPPRAAALAEGGIAAIDDAIWQRLDASRFRAMRFELEMEEVLPPVHTSRVTLADFARGPDGFVYACLHAGGELEVTRVARRHNLLTGRSTLTRTPVTIRCEPRPGVGDPLFLGLSLLGDSVAVIWADGLARCYEVRGSEGRLAEERHLVEPPARVTAVTFLLGRATILVGDSFGRIRPWFRARVEAEGKAGDGWTWVSPREFVGPPFPVTALASSPRSRLFVAGFGNGEVRTWHVTSGKGLGRWMAASTAVVALAVGPKEDAVLALTEDGGLVRAFDPRHPEVSLRSLFGRVWYESAPGPAHVWQSSSGTDDFEPKFGLMPLVFGTIKATVVAMVLAGPLALLAALYVSEFMRPRWKALVKPAVEMMAALPSVTLGFLAALVLAPVVARSLPSVLAALAVVPAAVLAASHLWQLLPTGWLLRLTPLRPLAILLAGLAGIRWSGPVGSAVERAWFAGDIMRWLDGQIGGPFGGWMLVLLPFGVFASAAVSALFMTPWIRGWSRSRSDLLCALADLVRFAALLVGALAVTAALSFAATRLGWDPRGGVIGTYVQRNALVVGFVMGFAIVPLIFTIAEDAFSAVPEHLRSASLASGATPWQTAVRIVMPAAGGGMFSAIMVGLGRAVGETMIVLMAAGNTPIMEWNIFNGFRTLAANIAVELPEAVRNSTHYRTLFLSSLVLFLLTFVINTAAETVRLRVRRRLREL